MKIEYDGEYPNLCAGELKVKIDGKIWIFPGHSLCSGGYVRFDENWSEEVGSGEWTISEYPENFPDVYKEELLETINNEIPWGCCGGCV